MLIYPDPALPESCAGSSRVASFECDIALERLKRDAGRAFVTAAAAASVLGYP